MYLWRVHILSEDRNYRLLSELSLLFKWSAKKCYKSFDYLIIVYLLSWIVLADSFVDNFVILVIDVRHEMTVLRYFVLNFIIAYKMQCKARRLYIYDTGVRLEFHVEENVTHICFFLYSFYIACLDIMHGI